MLKRLSASRNGEIDFWKFIFSIIIVIHHSYNFIPYQQRLFFAQGSICVDFFLIISGYFMASSIYRKKLEYNPESIGTDTVKFIFGKIKSFLYYYVFSSIIILITTILNNGVAETLFTGKIFNFMFSVLFLNMSGLPNYNIIGSSWYLSAMLLCMMIIYPIFRKNKNLFINVIAPLAAIFLYGYIMQESGYVGAPEDWYGIMYKGVIRGFAGISLGCVAYNISEWLKQKNISKQMSFLLSLYETLCILGVILIMGYKLPEKGSTALVFLFFTSFIIIASKTAVINKIYQYGIFQFAGKLSMAIFLIHGASIRIMNILCSNVFKLLMMSYTKEGCLKLTVLYVAIAFILGLVCVLICDTAKNVIDRKKELKQSEKNTVNSDSTEVTV